LTAITHITADGDHRLDAVCVGQRLAEPTGDAEAGDGEHLLESFAQRPGGVGMRAVELAGEVPTRLESLVWVGLREREAEAPVDDVTLVNGQVADDVLRLPALVAGPRLGGVRVHPRR